MSSHHQPIEQTVERMSDGVRRLAAQLLTPVSADQIWAVLTDYDQLSTSFQTLQAADYCYEKATRFIYLSLIHI